MLFERKIYQELLKWKKHSNGDTGLLITGAKCIGKSTIVEEFAKNEYKKYLIIDFSKADKVTKQFFEKYMNDFDTLFMLIQAKFNIQLERRNSLIVFKDVQYCPKARQAIKHLVADKRYDYIETGSTVMIYENVKDILNPSEEEHIEMYPMDFEEFLWAMNEKLLCDYIKKCFKESKPLDEGLHKKAMLLFSEYMLVGGMPESVKEFIENKNSFIKSDDVKKKILSIYKNDIKNIKLKYREKVNAIFNEIPTFLSKPEKRVVLSQIDKNNPKIRNYYRTFNWLKDSKICNESLLYGDPNDIYSFINDQNQIKCYMGDTGLLVSQVYNDSNNPKKDVYREIIKGNLSLNNGMFFENAVAQMLTSNGKELYFYHHYNTKKHRNDIEIDFIITNGSRINIKLYPIEVKPGIRYQTKSLEKFMKKYKKKIDKAYVIHSKNLMIKENGIICIPAYMTFCI